MLRTRIQKTEKRSKIKYKKRGARCTAGYALGTLFIPHTNDVKQKMLHFANNFYAVVIASII